MKFDRRQIDVEDVLAKLGVRNIDRRGDEVFYSCPFPGHANNDSVPSASMNVDTTGFHCFGCGEKGDVVRFVSAVSGVAPWTARQWLREAYMRRFREPPAEGLWTELSAVLARRENAAAETGELPEIDAVHLDEMRVDWDRVAAASDAPEALRYMLSRGFSPATLDSWEIGWDQESGRIAIPVRDRHGRLVGFKGRTPGPARRNKYVVLGSGGRFPTYSVARVLYGLHRAKGAEIVLCEGELNAMSVSEIHEGACAVGTSHLSDEQLRLLVDKADRVVVWFDSDQAGEGGMWDVVARVHVILPTRVVLVDKDPADSTTKERADAIAAARSPLACRIPSFLTTPFAVV